MTLISFVRNHRDLSTDRGFQFRFACDKCGNGYLSGYRASRVGMLAGLLRAIASLLGGAFGKASRSAWDVQRAIGGREHDAAFQEAVAEGRRHFHQCTACGRWVCPETCWNGARGLCEGCAPDEHEQLVAAQAQATSSQIFAKARATDLVAQVDMTQTHSVGGQLNEPAVRGRGTSIGGSSSSAQEPSTRKAETGARS